MTIIETLLADSWLLTIIIFSTLTYIFYQFAKSDPHTAHTTSASLKPYACGHSIDPAKEKVPSQSFYRAIISVFKLSLVKGAHKDDLSTSLMWMLAGVVFVTCYLLVLS